MQPVATSAALTLNSDFPESFVNGFISLGVADQPLLPTSPSSIFIVQIPLPPYLPGEPSVHTPGLAGP